MVLIPRNGGSRAVLTGQWHDGHAHARSPSMCIVKSEYREDGAMESYV
jgi:hypothetical protein